jgi:hypothetical protein
MQLYSIEKYLCAENNDPKCTVDSTRQAEHIGELSSCLLFSRVGVDSSVE